MLRTVMLVVGWWVVLSPHLLATDPYELPPIEYSRATPANRVAELQAALDRKESTIRYEPQWGYLRDLLQQLEIRQDSQMLVYSKTSLQRQRIRPDTPRAIYFNDDCYVGYCHEGDMIEISVADGQLGAVFYTLDQTNRTAPVISRQTHQCLQCHGSTQVDGIPGHLVRSVFVDRDGLPILSEGSHRVDHATPFEKRWGGWYVTGTHGNQSHLGNLVVQDEKAPHPWSNDQGQNVTDLSERFSTDGYLSHHSDIVALLVFEHQTHVHNLIAQAGFTTRQALHYENEINQSLGEPQTHRLESTTRRIQNGVEKLLEGLLMVREAPLRARVAGTTTFAAEFSQAGPHDGRGRSLRHLDLERRLFKYPCSFLVYSRAFDELPTETKDCLRKRLVEVLSGKGGEKFAHLSQQDRDSVAEILKATKPDLLPETRLQAGG
jgi:hypothetical protein